MNAPSSLEHMPGPLGYIPPVDHRSPLDFIPGPINQETNRMNFMPSMTETVVIGHCHGNIDHLGNGSVRIRNVTLLRSLIAELRQEKTSSAIVAADMFQRLINNIDSGEQVSLSGMLVTVVSSPRHIESLLSTKYVAETRSDIESMLSVSNERD